MIHIIPAISYIDNHVARAPKGDYKNATIYKDLHPLDFAVELEKEGIKWVHLLDLRGALNGHFSNHEMLKMISSHTNLFVDIGGGIMNDGDVRVALGNGADMISSASTAVHNRKEFASWLVTYGQDKVMLSVDAIEGKVLTRGRTEKGELDIMELIDRYYYNNIKYLKCTDVNAAGQYEGPSFDLYERIIKKYPDLKLIASGGVRNVDDVKRLESIGCHGVIFAKGLYEGKLRIEDLGEFL